MLEQLACDDDVEVRVLERQGLVEVSPMRLDPELLRLGERRPVCIDADDLVPARVRLCQCAIPAAKIENPPAGATDVAAEELDTLCARKDEPGSALVAVVLGITVTELFKAHSGPETRQKYTPAGEHEASGADRAAAGARAGRGHPLRAAVPLLAHHASRRRPAICQHPGARHSRSRRADSRRLRRPGPARALLRLLAFYL